MSSDTTGEMLGCLVMAVIALIIFVIGVFFWQPYKCASRFPDMETHYTFTSGCMVKTKQGWIPEDRYRVL